jgi:hypothetical protein
MKERVADLALVEDLYLVSADGGLIALGY